MEDAEAIEDPPRCLNASVWHYRIKGYPRVLCMVGPQISEQTARNALAMHFGAENIIELKGQNNANQ